MTKLRGYIPTTLMIATLMFGATAANAGIIVGDRTSSATKDTNPCEETKTDYTSMGLLETVATFAKTGIIVGDRNGIIVGDRSGIIVGDRSTNDTCGIIVGDRNGIIVGDRNGIIVGD